MLDGRWEVGQDDCRTGKRTDSSWRTSDTLGLALLIRTPHCSSTRSPLLGAARYSKTALPARARIGPACRRHWTMRDGDVLIVWNLDRLGRSLPHLIETVSALEKRAVG